MSTLLVAAGAAALAFVVWRASRHRGSGQSAGDGTVVASDSSDASANDCQDADGGADGCDGGGDGGGGD